MDVLISLFSVLVKLKALDLITKQVNEVNKITILASVNV